MNRFGLEGGRLASFQALEACNATMRMPAHATGKSFEATSQPAKIVNLSCTLFAACVCGILTFFVHLYAARTRG